VYYQAYPKVSARLCAFVIRDSQIAIRIRFANNMSVHIWGIRRFEFVPIRGAIS